MITDISRASYTDYQEYKEALDAELQQSAESFVRIGYMLKLARDTDILTGSGYNSVNEFARQEYNIDKTMVSRFISINDRFSEGGNSDRLQEQFRGFGYAKLSIMLQLPDAVNEEITPAFSKAEVQALKDEVDAERQVTDIEVMLEPKNEAQEGMESNLDKALYQLGHDNPELYAELYNVLAPYVGEEEARLVQEAMAPSGEGIFSIRIMGVGRLMLSIKDLDRDITLTNVRTGEKESYTWEQIVEAVDSIMEYDTSAAQSYEAVYDEKFPVAEPVEEKQKIAPVQPKPAPKKQSKVTKAPKPVPKKAEPVTPKVEPGPERIPPEDVEIVENTKCETDSEENETVLAENETETVENDTEKVPEAAEMQNAEDNSVQKHYRGFWRDSQRCDDSVCVVIADTEERARQIITEHWEHAKPEEIKVEEMVFKADGFCEVYYG